MKYTYDFRTTDGETIEVADLIWKTLAHYVFNKSNEDASQDMDKGLAAVLVKEILDSDKSIPLSALYVVNPHLMHTFTALVYAGMKFKHTIMTNNLVTHREETHESTSENTGI